MGDKQTEYLSHGFLENTRVDERSTPGERVLRGMCPRDLVERRLGRVLTAAQYERLFDLYSLKYHPIERPSSEHFLAFLPTVDLPRARVTYDDRGFVRTPSRIRSMSVPQLGRDDEDEMSWSLIR